MCGEGASCQGGGGKTRPPGRGDSVCACLGRSGRQASSPSQGEHSPRVDVRGGEQGTAGRAGGAGTGSGGGLEPGEPLCLRQAGSAQASVTCPQHGSAPQARGPCGVGVRMPAAPPGAQPAGGGKMSTPAGQERCGALLVLPESPGNPGCSCIFPGRKTEAQKS